MDRTGERQDVCNACPYARFVPISTYDSESGRYGYDRTIIECDPPMGECRLEYDAKNTDDYSKARP